MFEGFMLFLSCFCYAFVHVCLLMPCGYLLGNCEFVTFPLVSWVRWGALLYRLLIFAFVYFVSVIVLYHREVFVYYLRIYFFHFFIISDYSLNIDI